MISAQLALLLLTTPCQSAVAHQQAETIAVRCPAPEVQGPPAPLPVAEKPVVKPAKAKAHGEAKRHKKRRRRHG